MFTIYVPTYHRTKLLYTLRHIPEDLKPQTVILCPPEDEYAFQDLGMEVLVIQKGDGSVASDNQIAECSSIAEVRQWCLDNHDVENRGSKIFWFDDDLRFDKRRSDNPSRFYKLSPEDEDDFRAMIRSLELAFEESPVVGISNRLFANHRHSRYVVNSRMYRAWGVDVEVARAEGWRLDGAPVMEDFYMQLSAISAGYPTININNFVTGDNGSNAEGGVSHRGRRAAMQVDGVMNLVEAFPEVVKPVIKKGWSEDMPTRIDVRISWQKAAKIGKENRDLLGKTPIPVPEWDEDTGMFL